MGSSTEISAISSWPRNGTKSKPNITLMSWCWASFLSCFGAFFEDKTACALFTFLCHIDTPPSAHHGNCTSSEQKMDTFLCIGRKPERKKRVSAGCGNGVCSVSSDSAEKCLVGFPTRHVMFTDCQNSF